MKDTAVLLIDCPDRKGLIARVSSLLYERGANILHADQHQDHDLGLFFMRVEWALNGDGRKRTSPQNDSISKASRRPSRRLARELGMRWKLSSSAPVCRGWRCSARSICTAWPICCTAGGPASCTARFRSSFPITATWRSWRPFTVSRSSMSRSQRSRAARPRRGNWNCLQQHKVDLVVLARYMQILSPDFVARYPAAIINVHHSFLPAFTGAKPYHAAHARGVKLIGATSHYVTEVLDDGPIIEQDVARISHRDQVEDLVARGRDLERVVLSRAVRWHLDRRILCYGNKTVVFD